ncbi:MAG TPA: ankyrin repeat domain-containing protein [Tepidisphaeraceae bacterium]|nr:ankyrin repeat domain-containing protein [Tepidisphaeraceae bacterium]
MERIGPNMKALVGIVLLATAGWIGYQNRESFLPPEAEPAPEPIPPEQLAFISSVAQNEIDEVRRRLAADPSLATLSVGWFGSPLHVAAGRDLPEMSTLLLDHGASLIAQGRWGGTPLHWAAWCGAKRACDLLIARGADVEARGDAFDSTPLLWAAHGSANAAMMDPRSPPETADWVAVCELLIAKGARPDTANAEGVPATVLGTAEITSLLVKHGAEPPPPAATQPMDPDEMDAPEEDPEPARSVTHLPVE